uniref:Si:dkey-109a10.2 n=1 Tax=Neolamprologus brichardi TaxID=32507 RepID=A0A3Q4GJU6_NEOBR
LLQETALFSLNAVVCLSQLLLLHYASQSKIDIKRSCNEDVSLECPVAEKNSNFLSVAWYKVNNGNKHGIIRRGNGEDPVYYNFSREVTFGEKQNLLLRKVSPADSGDYECAISANVGGQNENHKVSLIINECVPTAPLTTLHYLNTTMTAPTSPPCQTQLLDLPVTWSIAGYAAVALAKIVLSLIVIWVIRLRSSRQRYNKWHD